MTKSVPNYALIIGNPGRIVGWVNKKGEKLVFDGNGTSICGKYRLENDTLEIVITTMDSSINAIVTLIGNLYK